MLSFKPVFTFAALLPFAQLVAAQSAVWGQCGGIGWSGVTTCGMSHLQTSPPRSPLTICAPSVWINLHQTERLLLTVPARRRVSPGHYSHAHLAADHVADHHHRQRAIGSFDDPCIAALRDLELWTEP